MFLYHFIFITIFYLSLIHADPSYSLTDCYGIPLDKKLIEILNMNNGVFIEVGANDGITQSNTKLLEECYGWTGILVEPSKNIFPLLCQNRPNSKCFQCALGSANEDGRYIYGDFDGNLMSSISGKRRNRAPTTKCYIRSLQSILDETGISHINFFSLDTEGYELNILKGIDFAKTTFDYMLIEIYTSQYDEIISFLEEKGYRMVSEFSNYSLKTNPAWDGTHNDYLFKKIL